LRKGKRKLEAAEKRESALEEAEKIERGEKRKASTCANRRS